MPRTSPGPRRVLLLGVLAALFVALLGYKILEAGRLEETALFYVGLPAALALTVAATARPRSAIGVSVVTTVIALALAGPLLNEGVVCLVMASPLFLLVAVGVGAAVRMLRSDRTVHHAGAAVLLPLLLAGAVVGAPGVMARHESVSRSVVVDASPAEVRAAIAASPDFREPLPTFLRLGFPVPLASVGEGLTPGDTRDIRFTDSRPLGIGAHPRHRAMSLEVISSAPGEVVFAVNDDTTLSRWLDMERSTVTWREVDATAGSTATEVTWTLEYERRYDPGWYFGPLQRFAAGQAAGYLLDSVVADRVGGEVP